MSIEGIDVWYALPALITGMYYMLQFYECLPHQGPGRKTVKPIFEVGGIIEVPKPEAIAFRGVTPEMQLDQNRIRAQRDVLRALFEEQSRAITSAQLGPLGAQRRYEILGTMVGKNGVTLESQGGALLVTMGANHLRIPMPAVGYLIPQVADAINRLQMREQIGLSTAIGGGAGVLGGMFGGGRGDTPSHFGGGWGSPVADPAIARVPRPPLLTKEPPWKP